MVESRLALVGALAALVACGGRSALGAPDGIEADTGGAPTGASSTTSSGAGGSGGAGATGPCAAVATPPRSFDLPNRQTGRAPRLVASSPDGNRVTLLTVASQQPLPLDAHPELRQVTFDDGWTAWPDAMLGSERLVGPTVSFVAPSQRGDGLTLWVNAATQATGEQTYYVDQADPLTESPPSTVLLGFNPPLGHVTVPVLGSSSVGYQQTAQTVLGLASTAALVPIFTDYCAQPPPATGPSDAVAVGDGFLVAVAAAELVGCDAPTTLRLLRHDVGELPVELASFSPPGLVSHLWLRERPGGAWLFAVLPASATVTLWALAVDAQAQPADAPLMVPLPPLFEPATPTVASVGEGFAYAMITSDSGEVGTIEVQSFDAGGNPTLGWSLTPAAAPRTDEALGLLAGPDGETLMLAWSSDVAEPGVAGNARVYASRLGCD